MPSRPDLRALSPIDGRYRVTTERLRASGSEYALIRYRVAVECQYFVALAREPRVPLTLTRAEVTFLEHLAAEFDEEDAALVQRLERKGYRGVPATRHDVKAVEYWLRLAVQGTSLEKKTSWIHFGLTSEDVNNIAYALMLRELAYQVLEPLQDIVQTLDSLAKRHAALPMLARTHGQSASPTTFGKEMRVFAERLRGQIDDLSRTRLLAKLNGASGNYNALAIAFPGVAWPAFSRRLIAGLNAKSDRIRLSCNLATTQIEPHDSYAELFHALMRINTIVIDFSQDMWRYISDGWVTQTSKPGEIGSSAMPHKVNPIDFENAEGNLGVANALLTFFAAKLPVSRLQRDLSDSTVERNFAVAFAHCLVAYTSLQRGLSLVAPDEKVMSAALEHHPEVLAEAIQTILRREGVSNAYELLKEATRGRVVTLDDLRNVIQEAPLSESVRRQLLTLTPADYVGRAVALARK